MSTLTSRTGDPGALARVQESIRLFTERALSAARSDDIRGEIERARDCGDALAARACEILCDRFGAEDHYLQALIVLGAHVDLLVRCGEIERVSHRLREREEPESELLLSALMLAADLAGSIDSGLVAREQIRRMAAGVAHAEPDVRLAFAALSLGRIRIFAEGGGAEEDAASRERVAQNLALLADSVAGIALPAPCVAAGARAEIESARAALEAARRINGCN
jgi:hypothetical protein